MFKLNLDCGKSVAFNLTEDDVAKLAAHPEVVQYVWHIGLKNILQDSHAPVTREKYESDDAWIQAKRDRASLKLGALMNGDVRTQTRERAPTVDDFTAMARKVILESMSKDERKALADRDDKAEFLDGVYVANADELRPVVEARLEAERAIAELKASAPKLNIKI